MTHRCSRQNQRQRYREDFDQPATAFDRRQRDRVMPSRIDQGVRNGAEDRCQRDDHRQCQPHRTMPIACGASSTLQRRAAMLATNNVVDSARSAKSATGANQSSAVLPTRIAASRTAQSAMRQPKIATWPTLPEVGRDSAIGTGECFRGTPRGDRLTPFRDRGRAAAFAATPPPTGAGPSRGDSSRIPFPRPEAAPQRAHCHTGLVQGALAGGAKAIEPPRPAGANLGARSETGFQEPLFARVATRSPGRRPPTRTVAAGPARRSGSRGHTPLHPAVPPPAARPARTRQATTPLNTTL